MNETQIITQEQADYTAEQRRLITDVLCKGGSEQEVRFFMEVANRCHLDPFKRQIHAVKRYDSKLQRETLTFQVSIEGLRAIAARTGEYAGNDEPIFKEKDGYIVSATATVWRLIKGQRVAFTATVYWDECVQTKKGGEPNTFWANKPRTMLGKCAEAAALRKGFPEEAGGLYTEEEMPTVEDVRPSRSVTSVVETKALPVEVVPMDEVTHWSQLIGGEYKGVFSPEHGCSIGEIVNDTAKRNRLLASNPNDGSLLSHAIYAVLWKVIERQMSKSKLTEDQFSTRLNERGIITGSILEQDGEKLMDVLEFVNGGAR